MLVQKISKPGEMISYFLKLLDKFPSHMFRAKWQNTQLKSLVKNLPLKHCITVHDFSENFKCKEQTEIQSDYFQKQEVSIHVTLIYRHAMLNADGVQSRPMIPMSLRNIYMLFQTTKNMITILLTMCKIKLQNIYDRFRVM